MYCIINQIINQFHYIAFYSVELVSDNPMLFYSAYMSIFLYLVLLSDKNLHSETERGGGKY